MGYVLFSPIGNTDPIRGFRDGAWLHICRIYQPRVCVVYLTAEMCRREAVVEEDGRPKDLYARTLALLNNHLYGEDTERYIQLQFVRDPACENAHSLEYFLPLYHKQLSQMHSDYPDDELLVNASSGTPGMKASLMALSALLPFNVKLIQVSDPEISQDSKNETVNTEYLVEEAFVCDLDNKPDFPNRTSLQPMKNLSLALRVNELSRLVKEGDYHTVLQEVRSDSLKSLIPSKTLFAVQGAELRSCMNLEDGLRLLEMSGFNMKKRYGLRHEDRIWQCAEYLLTMKNDVKNGTFDNFIRKLTPLLTNLMELYLAKVGKDVRKNGVDSEGKWRQRNTPADWQLILDSAFTNGFDYKSNLSTRNMLPLIDAFGNSQARMLAETLRKVEHKVRNTVAHEIVPFTRQELEAALQSASIQSPEALAERLREFLEIIQPFDTDYWMSYDAMNDHICRLLKSAQPE